MQMSALQTLMREHEREIEEVRSEIEEAREVGRELRSQLDANIKYFEEVATESVRAVTELFNALMAREEARLGRLERRLAELEERPAHSEGPRGNGQIAQVLGGGKRQ